MGLAQADAQNTAVDDSGQNLRASVTLNWAWRNRGVGGCQNAAVHHLEVWFCKISVRSNYMCGERWGWLEQICIPQKNLRQGNPPQVWRLSAWGGLDKERQDFAIEGVD